VTTLHTAGWVVPVVAEPIRHGGVLVDGDRIVAVAAADEITTYDARRDWPGVLTPGLVNAHTHLQYSSFADLATAGLHFADWIRELTRRRRTYDEAAWQESAKRGVRMMLESGTTYAADVVTDPAVLAVDVPGIAFLEAVGADDARWPEQRARLLDALDAAHRPVGVSPHTLYTLGTAVFRDCVEIARARALRLHTHLAETADEVEFVLAGTGRLAAFMERAGLDFELLSSPAGVTPTRHLDTLGGLSADCSVAHGVHVDADDRALLRRRAVTVALCPRSNRLLGAGEAPVAAYLEEGNPLAVGTDSLASSPTLDLLDDVRALHDLATEQGYAGDDLARRLVEAATAGGARSVGRDDIGVLRAGARADFAVFDVEAGDDPFTSLALRGAGRCVGTVLGGEVVHERIAT
jgi:cytosine/adenosine deaminase-related metal-dependent hydrolase